MSNTALEAILHIITFQFLFYEEVGIGRAD